MSPWLKEERLIELEAAEDALPGVQAALDRKTEYEGIQDETLRLRSEEIAGLNATVYELQLSLAALRISERVVAHEDDVRARLDEGLKTDIHIGLSPLMESVEAVLRPEAERRVTEEIRAGLVATEGARILEEVRVTEGPGIVKEQDEALRKTGVYDDLREKARLQVMQETRAELLANEKKKIDEKLQSPSYREARVAEIAEDIEDDPEVRDYEEARMAELYPQWRSSAVQLRLRRVEVEVLERKPEIEKVAVEEFESNPRGQRQLKDAEAAAEDTIKKMTTEQLILARGDEAHIALLAEREEIAAKKLEKQNLTERLLAQFFNGGIDTTDIEKGITIEIEMGEVTTKIEQVYENQRYINKKLLTLNLEREITLTSLGGGRFRADKDTARKSNNKLARKSAIPEGRVVVIGTLLEEQGEKGGKKITLHQVLRAGDNLHYDIDPDTPEDFQDSECSIANVKVNKTPVREFSKIEKKLL